MNYEKLEEAKIKLEKLVIVPVNVAPHYVNKEIGDMIGDRISKNIKKSICSKIKQPLKVSDIFEIRWAGLRCAKFLVMEVVPEGGWFDKDTTKLVILSGVKVVLYLAVIKVLKNSYGWTEIEALEVANKVIKEYFGEVTQMITQNRARELLNLEEITSE